MASRLDITGRLDSQTPFEVLELFCLCHEIDFPDEIDDFEFDRILAQCNRKPVAQTPEEIDIYLNPNVEWSEPTRETACKHLKSWKKRRDIPRLEVVGDVTPEQPNAIDVCILYRLCQLHGIPTNRTTTSLQMKTALEMKYFAAEKTLRSTLLQQISSMPLEQLLGWMTLSSVDPPEIGYDPNQIKTRTVGYDSGSEPQTHEQAVVATANQFFTDISSSRFPLEEYFQLSKGDPPKDPVFRDRFQRNRRQFDLRTEFNPRLPRCCYTRIDLVQLAIEFGIDSEEAQFAAYDQLSRAATQTTFYRFRDDFALKSEVTFLERENINNLDPEVNAANLLLFGSFSEPSEPVLISELAATFQNEKDFVNPFETERRIFNPSAVARLEQLCHRINTPESQELRQIMEGIRFQNITLGTKTDQVLAQYNSLSSEERENFRKAIRCILYIAMAMRGWMGAGPMPIQVAKHSADMQPRVFEKVQEHLGHYYQLLLTDGGKIVSEAPLIRYRENEDLEVYRYSGETVTIAERIGMVARNDSDMSCIRTSSNHLAASAHFYLRMIGEPAPFKLEELRSIA